MAKSRASLAASKSRRSKDSSASNSEHNSNNESAAIFSFTQLTILSLPMATPTRLLVCSIGNPGSYANTLHSAGHLIVAKLASTLSYPTFQKGGGIWGKGLVSAGSDYTFWQSTSYMNISGVGLASAWRSFVRDCRGEEPRLVVIHDELELPMGKIKVKNGSASAKGHNGLKSIAEKMKGVEYTRIGVGIGRPVSREPDEVAAYVLRAMKTTEKLTLEGCVGHIQQELSRLRGG